MSYPKESHGWEPIKFIPQLEKPPKYLIISKRVYQTHPFHERTGLNWKVLGTLAIQMGFNMMD
jgi:hypothetical protein